MGLKTYKIKHFGKNILYFTNRFDQDLRIKDVLFVMTSCTSTTLLMHTTKKEKKLYVTMHLKPDPHHAITIQVLEIAIILGM